MLIIYSQQFCLAVFIKYRNVGRKTDDQEVLEEELSRINDENFFAVSNFWMAKELNSDGINLSVDADDELRSSCLREKKLHIEHEVGISEIYIVTN